MRYEKWINQTGVTNATPVFGQLSLVLLPEVRRRESAPHGVRRLELKISHHNGNHSQVFTQSRIGV